MRARCSNDLPENKDPVHGVRVVLLFPKKLMMVLAMV
jgi:hypothetical protein